MIAFLQLNFCKDLPLTEFLGEPLLKRQLTQLRDSGFTRVYVCLSKEQSSYLDSLRIEGLEIKPIIESRNLGSAGALYYLLKEGVGDFAFIRGDVFFDIDWVKFQKRFEECEPLICPLVHPVPNPEKEDIYLTTKEGKAIAILDKARERDFYFDNLVDAGIYLVSKDMLDTFDGMASPIKMDFYEELLLPCVACEGVYVYQSPEYVRNCAFSHQKEKICRDLERNIPQKRNLKNPQKAIFLDRDGTINFFGDYVVKPEMLTLNPGAADAIKRINDSEYLAICATNQPVVARGETDLSTLAEIHRRMEDLLGAEGAYIDALYFCPHFPSRGAKGEDPELSISCDCRKPNIGMLLHAQHDFNIDLSASWFVGDTNKDVQTGINAGCKTVLLLCGDPNPARTNKDAVPTHVAKDLPEAIDLILGTRA